MPARKSAPPLPPATPACSRAGEERWISWQPIWRKLPPEPKAISARGCSARSSERKADAVELLSVLQRKLQGSLHVLRKGLGRKNHHHDDARGDAGSGTHQAGMAGQDYPCTDEIRRPTADGIRCAARTPPADAGLFGFAQR